MTLPIELTTPKPKIIHLLSDRNIGGIKSSSSSLTNSRLREKFEFLFLSEREVLAKLSELKPDIVIWHDPCSWRSLWRLLRLRFRTKLLIHEHHYSESFEHWKVRSPWRFRLMLRLTYGLAHLVVTISEGQKKWIRSHHLVRSQNLAMIRQCRILDQFLALPEKPRCKTLVLGAYGRFDQQKGFDTLLRAMQQVQNPNIELLIGGYGEHEDLLRSLAGDDPRIRFVGSLSDVPSFLAQCDVVIIPSNWEPWGNVCLESKAAAKAVIVSQVDGLTEQVRDCGLLVPPNDPAAFAEAIINIDKMSPEELSAWGIKGRELVRNAWEDYLISWEGLLCQLLAN
ncbi:glycosyltransferase [Pseudanabaena sp. lw0831]|uniref:glycosyltransferase family 4 protein n=1 Tax=Pseudanabaena sp. lw0831 TaxID=1357935 RepID=UPI001915DCB0|nr:glycosyltransferase family 4 protein [Pseudanabaena sp. lw0831]GBO54644.1 glycosyltransferase [Pseudanabaena sp. lw0831]